MKEPYIHKRIEIYPNGRRRRDMTASKTGVLCVDADMAKTVKDCVAKLNLMSTARPAIVIGAEYSSEALGAASNDWLLKVQQDSWANLPNRWTGMRPVGFDNPSEYCHLNATLQMVAALIVNSRCGFDYKWVSKKKLELFLRIYTQGGAISSDCLQSGGIFSDFVPETYVQMQQDAAESYDR